MVIKKGKGKLGVKDYIDYGREMAAKGELHALDTASGGLFGNRKKINEKFPKKSRTFKPNTPNLSTNTSGKYGIDY